MKKGFTLVELIVIIIILSVISAFTFQSLNKTILKKKDSLYNIQIKNIIASAENYINKEQLFYNNDNVIITLCQLKKTGFIDEKIKDPRTGNYIPDDSKIFVYRKDDGNEYVFKEGTNEFGTCFKDDNKIIEYVELGSIYNENIEYFKRKIIDLNNNNVVDNIDTNIISSYFIEYTLKDYTLVKYLYVIDSTNPNIKYREKHIFIDKNGNEIESDIIGAGVAVITASNNSVFTPYEIMIDDMDDNISFNVKTNVNLSLPGTYYVIYQANDSNGNNTNLYQTIIVEDKIKPVIDDVIGINTVKTSNSIIVSVLAHDDESGLHPRGAYSFDGGVTWQIDNSITIDNNCILDIVVRDSSLNKTSIKKEIKNILKDDKTLSFIINKGKLKNNGWFIDNVDVLIKPLINSTDFYSFSYWTTKNPALVGNNIKTSYNFSGDVVSFKNSSNGSYVCGYVTKKDGSKTDTLCSMVIRIDKDIPTCDVVITDDNLSGTSGYIIVKDSTSGPLKGFERINFINLKKTTNYTIDDNAGNKGTCTVKVVLKDELDYLAMMKNGYSYSNGGTEFWNKKYKQYIKTINFSNNLNGLPTNCTKENLCWDISYRTTQVHKVYGYLVDTGLKDSNDNTKPLYNLYIVSDAQIFAPFNSSSIFYSFKNLTQINFNNNFITDKVKYMNSMFGDCLSLRSLDLSSFNTKNVIIMGYMFVSCKSLTSLKLSNFNTSNVTDMTSMFRFCSALTSLNLSSFNTVNVTSMDTMFEGCSSLTRLDISNFNTAKVIDMSRMFFDCTSLTNLDLSSFNTANVINMKSMFWNCSSLTRLDLSKFNTASVQRMDGMFYKCSSLTNLDLSSFNTAKVIDMWVMFRFCSSLTNLDLSSFNTAKVTSMSEMFSDCSSLISLNLHSFNTSNVTNMSAMFGWCSSLISLNLSNFNTVNVTNMRYMFHGCSSLTRLDISNFNTAKVIDMSNMFFECSSLTSLNLNNFNTANVTDMSWMFYECSSLTSLGSRGFNIVSESNIEKMFLGCSSLTTTINIMNANISNYSMALWNAATKSGTKIFVNYIASASTIVDNMIKDIPPCNIVKGRQI